MPDPGAQLGFTLPHGEEQAVAEVSFPTRTIIGEKIVPALRNLGGSATRRQVINEAIRLGNYTEAQRSEPARSKRHPNHTYLEHALGNELSRLKAEGVVENPVRGVWQLPQDAR
jgi:hypothetical protein